jgi:hypothetical protein
MMREKPGQKCPGFSSQLAARLHFSRCESNPSKLADYQFTKDAQLRQKVRMNALLETYRDVSTDTFINQLTYQCSINSLIPDEDFR